MRYALVFLFCSTVLAVEPSAEQLALMSQYGLTVPPIIHHLVPEAALSMVKAESLPQLVSMRFVIAEVKVVADAPTALQLELMRENHLTLPPIIHPASWVPGTEVRSTYVQPYCSSCQRRSGGGVHFIP